MRHVLRKALLPAGLCLLLLSPAAQAQTEAAPPPDEFPRPEQWQTILTENAERFLAARSHYQQARQALDAGDREAASAQIQAALDADADFAPAHFSRAKVRALRGDPTALGDWIEGIRASFVGYPAQARWAGNALLGLDLILGLTLLWVVFVLFLRYAPFLRHQWAGRLDPRAHARHANRWLWPVVALPLALGWGLVPTLALLIPVLWLYGQTSVRVFLTLVVGWLALQGIAPGPFGAVTAGLDPQSVPSLVARAGRETPHPALRAQIESALARHPESEELLFAKGLHEARAGRFERSNESFLAYLARRPDDPLATANLANNHFYLGDIDRAVAGYQRAASLDATLGANYYNLSQAYLRKLFLKEGSAAMQQALRAGFDAQRQASPLPRGAVYYVPLDAARMWRLAWKYRDETPPYLFLAPVVGLVGTPVDHAGWWLGGSLMLAMLMGMGMRRDKLVFECANCGRLACRRCQGEHEGAVLCFGCAGTAARARSEVVLGTLLRNRRVEAELSFQSTLNRLNQWAFGSARIYNGLDAHGVALAMLFSALVAGALVPHWPLDDPWSPAAAGTWSALRIGSLAGLAVFALISRWGRVPFRRRKLHLHPANLVSLVDLIEGLPKRKLGA
jgi:tetratricopeptide (TPR) repeat protein